MDASDDITVWHPETVTSTTRDTLRALRDRGMLEGMYLAGGTALALHFGHRLSVDLDFFSNDLFDADALLRRVEGMPAFSVVSIAPHTLHATIQETKVSFLGYPYPALFPFARFDDVPVADPRDIACMKVTAIVSRGTKRDFIDFYMACQQLGIVEILTWFGRKYATTGYNRLHILKSLTFFDDAEKDPMPHTLVPLAWEDVRRFFRQEVPRLR